MMKKMRNHKKSSQSGNIFFMLFASVALIGAVTVGANNTMKGIVTSMSDVTRKTIAEEKMMGAARLAIQASTVTAGGNCDGVADPTDVQVEPLPFRTATGVHPDGGGWVPLDIGATDKDPWGTNYGYCVWDPGPTFDDPACGGPGANRLDGTSSASDTVVAIISAGKDKKFSTTCGTGGGGGGGWSPADLAVAPLIWFDAQTPASIVHTAGAVTTWTDRSNSRVATLDGGSASPTYSATSFQGVLPGVAFTGGPGGGDGSNGQRMVGTLPVVPANANVFAFLVMDWGGVNTGFGQAISVNGGGNAYWNANAVWVGANYPDEATIFQFGNSYYSETWSTSGDILYAGVRSASDEFVTGFNGAAPGVRGTGTPDLNASTTHFYIGGDAGDNNYHVNGTIGEFLWLGYEPSQADRESIEGYLAHKWGLEAKLPGGHPYKSAPPGGGGGGGSSVTRAAGSDDIILEYTYADAGGIGGEDLWKIMDIKPDTAMIDKNIEVGGTTQFGGALNLMGSGLILPDSTATGACDATTDQQLRMNFTVSPPSLEICDYGAGAGLGWTAMAMAGGGGPAPTTEWEPPANIVGWWKLDETSGSTIADEMAAHNGTWSDGSGNSVAEETAAGKDGTAISFDGVNDQILIANPTLLNFGTANYTIVAWIKSDPNGLDRPILSKSAAGSWASPGKEFFVNPANELEFDAFGVGGVQSTGTLDSGWHHVAVTFTDSTNAVQLYIDGVPNGSGTLALTADNVAHVIKIGGVASDSTDATLDNVMIFERALTAREIMDIYRNTGGWEAPAGSGGSDSTNLVAHWPFDEGSGTTTADSSGNGHDGTLTNEGGSLPLWNSGHIGTGSLTFDVDNSVRVPDPGTDSDLDFTTGDSITIMSWIKPDPFNSQWGAILNKGTVGSDDSNYSFWQGNGAGVGGSDLSFVITSGNGNYSNMGVDQSVLTQGVWQHVAVTFTFGNSSAAKFYVNGVEYNGVEKFGDMDSAPTQNNAPILLGHTNQPDPFNYQGGIDDVRLYKGIMSAAQIADVYAQGGGSTNPGNSLAQNVNKYRGKISSGGVFACGIKSDASLWCWGRDAELQLGNGTVLTATTNSPSRVNSGDAFTEVAASNQQACALKGDGTLWCWGANSDGRLGLGDTTPRASPTQVGTARWTNITMGTSGGCGVQVNGAAYCWGAGTLGKLGNNATSQQTSPVAVNTATGGLWSTLSAGHEHTCGIKTDGSAWCWGSDGIGRLGDGATLASVQVPKPVAEQGPWTSISAGENHTCAVKLDGSAWCWGQNTKGQLGIGQADSNDHPIPERVTDPGPWLSIVAGEQAKSTCGIKADGTMWCWGEDLNGRLGNGSTLTVDQVSPSMVSDPGPWVEASFGAYPCGTKADGSAWCWGPNSAGQAGALGTGDNVSIDIPGRVVNFPGVAPFRWTGNTGLEAVGVNNIAMGTAGISYDGMSDATPLPNGLSFPGSGRTRLRYASSSGGSSLPSGVLAYWNFNEGSGTTAADSSGNGYNGTFNGTPIWTTGISGSALEFDANSVGVADISALDLTAASTISLWIKPNTISFNKDIMGKGDGFNIWQYSIQTSNNQVGTWFFNNGTATADERVAFTTGNVLTAGTWTHYAQTLDPATDIFRIYINGILVSHTNYGGGGSVETASFKNTNQPFYIGSSGYAGAEPDSVMDEVVLYDRALSAPEIAQLYAATGGGGGSGGSGSELKVETLATGSSAQISLKAASAANVRSVGIDHVTGGLEFGVNNAGATNWMNAIAPQMEILPSGNVGVGTSGTAPFRLNIDGGLKVGDDTDACTTEKNGTLKYVSGEIQPWKYCDGSAWVDF